MTFNLAPRSRPSNINARRSRAPFSSIQEEVNQVFDNFFNDFQSQLPAASLLERNAPLSIPVDIIESDKSYKIEAEIPGMKQEDVDVTVNNNSITIKAEKREAKEDKAENYVCRERFYGACQRTLALPEDVNADKAKATFKRGVLWVEIPKKEGAAKASHKLEISEAA